MLKPEEQIARFKEQVSWVKDYRCITEMFGRDFWKPGSIHHKGNCFVIKTDSDTTLNAVFCDAANFWDVVEILQNGKKDHIWVIVEDYLPPQEIERFVYQNQNKVIPFFMDVKSAIAYNDFVYKILDGVDWQKSLCSGQLKMEWN